MIKKFHWIELPCEECTEPLITPFCGFYKIYRFVVPVSEQVILFPEDTDIYYKLVLIEINLNAYKESKLTPNALKYIHEIFEYLKKYGVQMIVRFLYDWDGESIRYEPNSIDIIICHMRQLTQILHEYDSNIYIVQGLFAGDWGEMHGGRYANELSFSRLYSTLKKCVGDNTYISVRSPALWRQLSKTYNVPTGLDDKWHLKLGLYNDAIMASENDLGTYGSFHKAEVKNYDDKMKREYELEFQSKLCEFVPNGGEAIMSNPLNDFDNAAETLRRMHISYLNSEYDAKVLDKWKRTSVDFDKGAWQSKSGYDYIAAHLGYRYCIESTDVRMVKTKKNTVRVQIKIKNTGFSVCYRKLKLSLVAYNNPPKNADEEKLYCNEIEDDTRLWLPDTVAHIKKEINVESFISRPIHLAIKAEEPLSGLNIPFANTFYRMDTFGNCLLGVFTIKESE